MAVIYMNRTSWECILRSDNIEKIHLKPCHHFWIQKRQQFNEWNFLLGKGGWGKGEGGRWEGRDGENDLGKLKTLTKLRYFWNSFWEMVAIQDHKLHQETTGFWRALKPDQDENAVVIKMANHKMNFIATNLLSDFISPLKLFWTSKL